MSEYDDKMKRLRESLPQGSTVEKRSKADQAKFSNRISEADRVYGGGQLMPPSEMGHTPITQSIQKTKAPSEKPERSTYWDFSEWEKRQPNYGKPKRREPTLKERGIGVGAASGKEPTWAERVEAYKKAREDNYSSDEVIGIGIDGNPRYQRGTSTGGGFGGEPPENVDGAADTAMDIYRKSAKNYPKDAPIEEQQGFAVAASTQDYNSQGYSTEEPETSTVVQYDGRVGELREYDDGAAFFVSATGNIVLRLESKD